MWKKITTVKREGREGMRLGSVQAHGRLCTAHVIKLAPDLLLELNINNAYYSKLNSISKGKLQQDKQLTMSGVNREGILVGPSIYYIAQGRHDLTPGII